MELRKDLNILIVGLGLIGGSYARALTKKGYHVKSITKSKNSIDFALKNSIIEYGTTEIEPMREMMRRSTARRALFDKNDEERK